MKLKVSIIIGVIIIGVLYFNLFDDNKTSASIMNDVTKEEITDVVGVYIKVDDEYIKSDTIPEVGYLLNESESYCRVNGEEDTNISISYDVANKTLSITPLTTRGTKCYLYFDETLNGAILSDNPTIDNSRSNGITGPLTDNTTGTLYTAEDDYGTSYFYAGDVDNNWVSFAGFYWRIIRINGDGSIRMIYSGEDTGTVTEANRTGEATQIGTSAFNEHANDNAYVGYMYGTPGSDTYEETHANINDSTIKTVLDNWYQQNLLSYSSYISTEQGFCNDRVALTGAYTNTSYGTLAYGTNPTTYAPFGRLYANDAWKTSQTPSLKCSQTNDYFTVSGSSRGNRDLDYPIGPCQVNCVSFLKKIINFTFKMLNIELRVVS